MKTIKLGLIGAGGIAQAHCRAISEIDGAELVAASDLVQANVERTASRWGIPKTFNDYNEMLKMDELDGVVVCTPTAVHAPPTIAALKAGKHVLCEKPLATTVEDCQRIAEAASRSGRKVTVHHQMRFVPTFERAKELIDNGHIGKVFAIEADYYHDMRRRAMRFDHWRLNPQTYQNIVLGGACHPIDLMQWILGDEIVEHVHDDQAAFHG